MINHFPENWKLYADDLTVDTQLDTVQMVEYLSTDALETFSTKYDRKKPNPATTHIALFTWGTSKHIWNFRLP